MFLVLVFEFEALKRFLYFLFYFLHMYTDLIKYPVLLLSIEHYDGENAQKFLDR